MHRQIAPLAATLKNVLLDETVYLIILVLARDKREEKKTRREMYQMCLTPGAVCRLLAVVMRSLMPEGNGKKRKQKRRELYQMCLTPGAVCRLLAGGDAEFDARGKWLVLEEWTETVHLP